MDLACISFYIDGLKLVRNGRHSPIQSNHDHATSYSDSGTGNLGVLKMLGPRSQCKVRYPKISNSSSFQGLVRDSTTQLFYIRRPRWNDVFIAPLPGLLKDFLYTVYSSPILVSRPFGKILAIVVSRIFYLGDSKHIPFPISFVT